MSVFNELRDAIANQRTVMVTTRFGRRTIQPLRIYQQPDGTYLVECYQLSGVSKWKMPKGFKMLRLEDLADIIQGDGPFEIPDGFNPEPLHPPGRAVAQVITPPATRGGDAPGQLFSPFLADVPLEEFDDEGVLPFR